MWILTQWRLILSGMALVAILGLYLLWQTAIAQRDLARADLQNYKQAAEAAAADAKVRSDLALKEIKDEIPRMVEQAKANAWKNFQAKYGMGNAACGIRADGLFPRDTVHNGQAGSPSQPDATSGEPMAAFVAACARDAGRLKLWQDWAITNELKVAQ